MENLKFDANGLIPAVVQDDLTNKVLMVAWMNMEAYNLTRKTGLVHFWSRSRKVIWLKGETSGNTLSLKSMWLDCDGDTLLVRVSPAGPACHTGEISCFFREIH